MPYMRVPSGYRKIRRRAMSGDPGIRVTVEDLSGEQEPDSVVIRDDYVITCAGSCYVANIQAHANGTHVLTIKGRKS